MTVTSVNVAYRPVRVGCLVREGVTDDVVAAATLNTMSWGGIFNPLVPVGSDVDAACADVERTRVDALHAVGSSDEIAVVIERNRHLRLPLAGADSPFTVRGEQLGVVTIPLLVRHYHDRFFRHPDETSRCVHLAWEADDVLAALFAVEFGQYPTSSPGPRCRRAFVEGLRSKEVEVTDGPSAEIVDGVTPILFTADSLRSLASAPASGIYVGDPGAFSDLVAFWNLRAAGASVAFWPEADSTRMAAYCREYLRRSAPRRADTGAPSPITIWHSDTFDSRRGLSETLAEIIAEIGGTPVWHRMRDASDVGVPWAIVSTDSQGVLATVEANQYRTQNMVLPLPDSPYGRERSRHYWHEQWLAVLSTYSSLERSGYTFEIPPVSALTEWASNTMRPAGSVRVHDPGVAVFADPGDTSLSVRLVSESEIVEQLLNAAGIHSRLSTAGEACRRIIDQMEGLYGCRLLRLPGLRRLLWASENAVHRRDALRTIEDKGSFSRYKNVDSAGHVFQTLLDRGVFQVGLHMQCPSCHVTSRFLPNTLDVEVRCPRCGSTFLLASQVHGAEWKYQPSGFFATHHEHGSIPVILTMMRLDDPLADERQIVVPSHNLRGHGIDCEVDLVALSTDRDGTVAMAVGECKGGNEQIQAADIEDLLQVVEKMRGIGIDCYALFATTRPAFSADELALFHRYRSAGSDAGSNPWPRDPILLTWRELGTRWPGRLGHRLPGNLGELARRSSAQYLSDDPPEFPDPEELLI